MQIYIFLPSGQKEHKNISSLKTDERSFADEKLFQYQWLRLTAVATSSPGEATSKPRRGDFEAQERPYVIFGYHLRMYHNYDSGYAHIDMPPNRSVIFNALFDHR